tara:strand:+ start:3706 stop:4173 length:468 start_codon:yes stop_codon:yes gene_type:complete
MLLPAANAQETEVSQGVGEWILQCADEGDISSCEALYIADIIVEDTQISLFRFSLSKTEDGKDYGILYFPYVVDLFLGAPPTLIVDGQKQDKIPWINCSIDGCWAHKVISPQTVSAMKGGRDAVLRLQMLDGRNLDVSFSLMGITATLGKLIQSE